MSKLRQLAELGQSVWYDYIQRSLLGSRQFQELLTDGLRGMTSNPSIFKNAVTGSADYDKVIKKLKNASVEKIYQAIVLEDITRAADLFLPVYNATEGLDGYVSLEVSPLLAYDQKRTVEEAVRLFNQIKRHNVMIKVPATEQGIAAVSELISLGININVTLIFGMGQYKQVVDAFIRGLESFHAAKGRVSQVASVASFFVSRVDTAVDKLLEAAGNSSLLGKIAVANSKVAFAEAKKIFAEPRWKKLEKEGARVQRLLWASTGTKNPAYPDTLYVDELIGADTVNTMPPATLEAFIDHGVVRDTLGLDVGEARRAIDELRSLGIDLEKVTQQLLTDGVKLFEDAFKELLNAIAEKKQAC